MDLLALADFNLVAEHGGIGRASRASGRSKATLSRHVLELEQSLGVRLVERGARAIRLTEEGHDLHARTRLLLGEIALAGQAVSGGLAEPSGMLRISAPVLFAHVLLGRIAADFVAAFPKVMLEVAIEDHVVDLIDGRYDLVIRANPQPDDELVGRCFMRDDMLVVAPPSLSQPDPCSTQDVVVPAVVRMDAPGDAVWRYSTGGITARLAPRPVLRLGSMLMIRDAVRAGAGVAKLPASTVRRDLEQGALVCWGNSTEPPAQIWALHTSCRLVNSKVQAMTDFLQRTFA